MYTISLWFFYIYTCVQISYKNKKKIEINVLNKFKFIIQVINKLFIKQNKTEQNRRNHMNGWISVLLKNNNFTKKIYWCLIICKKYFWKSESNSYVIHKPILKKKTWNYIFFKKIEKFLNVIKIE